MAEVMEYIPLVRQVDITLSEMLNKNNVWETELQEGVITLLRSMADAMENYPEHIPPPNFGIRFTLDQNGYNVRLVAKVIEDG